MGSIESQSGRLVSARQSQVPGIRDSGRQHAFSLDQKAFSLMTDETEENRSLAFFYVLAAFVAGVAAIGWVAAKFLA